MFNKFLDGEISWPRYEGKDIVELREKRNMTQDALAVLIGVTRETVEKWEKDLEVVPGPAVIALCAIDKLGAGVFDLMDPEVKHFALTPVEEVASDMTRYNESEAYNLAVFTQNTKLPEPFDCRAVAILRKRLGMTRRVMAKRLGVSTSIVDKWELGTVELQGTALMVLKILWLQGAAAFPDEPETQD